MSRRRSSRRVQKRKENPDTTTILIIGGLVIATGVGVYFLTRPQQQQNGGGNGGGGGGGNNPPPPTGITYGGNTFSLTDVCARAGQTAAQTGADPSIWAALCQEHGGTPAPPPTTPPPTNTLPPAASTATDSTVVWTDPHGVPYTRLQACQLSIVPGGYGGKTPSQWYDLCSSNGGSGPTMVGVNDNTVVYGPDPGGVTYTRKKACQLAQGGGTFWPALCKMYGGTPGP